MDEKFPPKIKWTNFSIRISQMEIGSEL